MVKHSGSRSGKAGSDGGGKTRPGGVVLSTDTTPRQFAVAMKGIMAGVMCGKITPAKALAACAAGRNMLKVVELRARYGEDAFAFLQEGV